MEKIFTAIGNHPLIPKRTGVRQFIKFALVGVVNTMIDFSVYAGFVLWFDVHYLLANIFAFIAAASNSYLLNRRWTFRSADPRWRAQAAKYFTVLAIGFGLNELILYALVEHGSFGKFVGKGIAIVVVLFWNFGANKLWTFTRPPAAPAVFPRD